MLQRSRDAAFLNSVVNHPAVLPHVLCGYEGPLDMTALVSDERNVFLANEHGGFLYVNMGEYVYEVHTQFLPEGRGAAALTAAKQSLAYMFTKTDALRIDTYSQLDNPPAERLARAVGFTQWGEISVNGRPCRYFVLTLKEWARSLDLCQ